MSEDYIVNVVPDRIDLRDREYYPSVDHAPPKELDSSSGKNLPILHQGRTNACTGFALSTVIRLLLRKANGFEETNVSPFMLYSMALRYDRFEGEADLGSSLRGALKGWYHHGVCREDLWRRLEMPPIPEKPDQEDWWFEAHRRPLGAYYRITKEAVADMQIALSRVGVIYASCYIHSGWNQPLRRVGERPGTYGVIKFAKGRRLGGHAVAIIGYNEHGFIIQNSWGPGWGDRGRAILSYNDWLQNAMDVWVAQLGVVTAESQEIANSQGMLVREKEGSELEVKLSTDRRLAYSQIEPYILNVETTGELRKTGKYRRTVDDLKAYVDNYLPKARRDWGGTEGPIDLALVVPGGLTDEEIAADVAKQWVPALYGARIMPLFLVWETSLIDSVKNLVHDKLAKNQSADVRLVDPEWKRDVIESTVRPLGTRVWTQVKETAERIALSPESGLRQLMDLAKASGINLKTIRIHLIAHSAGCVLVSHLTNYLCRLGVEIASLHMMAGAARIDLIRQCVLPHIRGGRVGSTHFYHLTDALEQGDNVMPILAYDRSLLYLVSNALEGDRNGVPLVGLGTHIETELKGWKLPPSLVQSHRSVGHVTASPDHLTFIRDDRSRQSIIRFICDLRGTGVEKTTGTRGQVFSVDAQKKFNYSGFQMQAGRRYSFTVYPNQKWNDWFVDTDENGFSRAYLEPLRRYLRVSEIDGKPMNFFTLIGTIGKNYQHVFQIQNGTTLDAPASGRLYCFANDLSIAYGNNRGRLRVRVEEV